MFVVKARDENNRTYNAGFFSTGREAKEYCKELSKRGIPTMKMRSAS